MTRAKPIDGFDPGAPLGDMLRLVVRARLEEALELWRPTIATSEPEALHDLRVSLRRVRSVLGTFRREGSGRRWRAAERALRRAFRATNGLRDADVMDERLKRWVARAPEGAAEGVEVALARVEKMRRRALPAAREALGPRRRVVLERRVFGLCDGPRLVAADAAHVPFGRWAPARLRAVVSGAETLGAQVAAAPESTEALHALRIALKRVRYLAEVFEPGEPGPLDEAIDGLRELQDALGEVRDLDVQMGLLVDLQRRNEVAWLREACGQAHSRSDPGTLLAEVLREGEPPEREGLLWLLDGMARERETARRTALLRLGPALAEARAALDGALAPFGGLDAAEPAAGPAPAPAPAPAPGPPADSNLAAPEPSVRKKRARAIRG